MNLRRNKNNELFNIFDLLGRFVEKYKNLDKVIFRGFSILRLFSINLQI